MEARDASAVAAGSSWVLVGAFSSQFLRFLTTRALSQILGPAAFGVYTSVITVAQIAGTTAAMGLDSGLVYLGSRMRQASDAGRLKGLIWNAFSLAAASGPLMWLAILAASRGTELERALSAVAPVVIGLAFFIVGRGLLQHQKNMRAIALIVQLGNAAAIMVLTVLAALVTGDVHRTLHAYVLAYVLVTPAVVWTALRAEPSFWDAAVERVSAMRDVLRFSVPQTFAVVLRDVNQWADVLMLTVLAASSEVAVYRVALALAMIGRIPLASVQVAFRPMVAEVLAAEDHQRLQALLWTVIRWLVLGCAPLYAFMFVWPEMPLRLFDERYLAGADVLSWLVAAEGIFMFGAPTLPLILMSGRSTLNLVNSTFALGVNLCLNVLWIPVYGAAGAAAANLVALTLFVALFVVQSRYIFGVTTFTAQMVVLMLPSLVACVLGTQMEAEWARAGLLFVAFVAHAGVAWSQGLSSSDRDFLDRLMSKARALTTRK